MVHLYEVSLFILNFLRLVSKCSTKVQVASSDNMSQIPRIRSPLARAVYNRIVEDQCQRDDDHHYWYSFNTELLPDYLRQKFIQFDQDKETSDFLENCYEKADWVFTQIGHSITKSILGWFMTPTSINGLLSRGSMFIFSDDQIRMLLGVEDGWKGDNLLDLGAGDGMVTQKMAKYFRRTYATEMSPTMVWRLQRKVTSKILDVNSWNNGNLTYDLIGCLNLLDRCNKPISILHSMRQVLTPGVGRVIVAVVLPFKPYVEQDSKDHIPKEAILLKGHTFEEQTVSLIEDVFKPAMFEVERFTRLPYLCEGDLHHSFYVLSDALFVLKPR
ncbi:hypothetical protein FSP39_008239 [Pinctada imbricata]|uniref:Methyltransferase-like protein 9 n=1 Tax=Pinctada imbricata TaxID=66713 RepID=A0AA88XIB4_PINIB|nr:hypothetical protein FSP39_008239 [Pinctada imbricata]